MTDHVKSTFVLTVPQEFYNLTCAATGQPFADSYLYGASLEGPRLIPRTRTGYRNMKDRRDFMTLLKKLGIVLVEPPLWQEAGKHHPAKSARDFG